MSSIVLQQGLPADETLLVMMDKVPAPGRRVVALHSGKDIFERQAMAGEPVRNGRIS